jgi:hypothetical protein
VASVSRVTAWAAASLLVAGLLLASLLFRTSGARAPTRAPQPITALTAPDSPVLQSPTPHAVADPPAPADVAPPELIATADELQAQYEQRKADMPVDLSAPLDEEMGVIEGAVANLLAAIAAEPENESLKRMLVATYRNEVRLLKKALHLSSEGDDAEESLE